MWKFYNCCSLVRPWGKLLWKTGLQNTDFAKVAGGNIAAVVAIPSGGWYIGGSFNAVNGESRNKLARIKADGSLHPFNPNMSSTVSALALDASGNLYAGGDLSTVGGSTTRNRLCKFDTSGVLTSFDPNMSNYVSALALDASGNLYTGGAFTTVGGSTTRSRLCKFDASGALTSFDPNMSSIVSALELDASGNLYAGGDFTTVGGSTTRNRLCKFDTSGVLTSFDPNMSNSVSALALDASGNLYTGGSFTTVGGSTTRNRLCKFDASGTLTSFNPTMGSIVIALALDASGNLYAGVGFPGSVYYLEIYSLPCTVPSVTATSSNARCGNGSITIGATPSAGSIKWYTAASGGTSIVDDVTYDLSGNNLMINNLTATTTFYAEAVDGSCVSAARTAVAVTVNTVPTAPTAAAQTFCGTTTASSLIPAISATIKWYADNTTTTALAATEDVITGTYFVSTVSAEGCESTRTSVSVTVNTVPTAPTAAAQTFCGATTANSLVPAISSSIKWYANDTTTTALVASDVLTTGTYYVSETVNGCESTRTSVAVSLADTTNPTAIAQNITVSLNASGTISVTPSMINNGSSDNCAIANFQINNASSVTFTCADIGTNNVELKVVDVSGNVATANAVVNVIDVISPTVITQDITVTLNDSGTFTV
uniref:Ig-like domain-containing protein n=1 Tax=Flavobacterium sp. TaxID=239 RepID=UPI00286DDD67